MKTRFHQLISSVSQLCINIWFVWKLKVNFIYIIFSFFSFMKIFFIYLFTNYNRLCIFYILFSMRWVAAQAPLLNFIYPRRYELSTWFIILYWCGYVLFRFWTPITSEIVLLCKTIMNNFVWMFCWLWVLFYLFVLCKLRIITRITWLLYYITCSLNFSFNTIKFICLGKFIS